MSLMLVVGDLYGVFVVIYLCILNANFNETTFIRYPFL